MDSFSINVPEGEHLSDTETKKNVLDTLSINLPEGEDLSVTETKEGVFEVQNAYEGTVEYFKGKPIQIEPVENCTEPGEPPPIEKPAVAPAQPLEPAVDQPIGPS